MNQDIFSRPVRQDRIGNWLISTVEFPNRCFETCLFRGYKESNGYVWKWEEPREHIRTLTERESIKTHNRIIRETRRNIRMCRKEHKTEEIIFP